jgi:DNA replication protein DnaC
MDNLQRELAFHRYASILIERLAKAEKEKKLEDKIRGLSKFQLLIIDEIGYLPFDELGAHCFFQLISRRYEKASTIFTSNKSYGEWGDIFKIMSLRQPFSIGFCTIAQRST